MPLFFAPNPSKFKRFFILWLPWSMRSMSFLLINSYCLTSTLPLPRLWTPSKIRMMLPVWTVFSGFSNYGLMPCWRIGWHTVLLTKCQSSLILVAFDCLTYHILRPTTHILRSSFIFSSSLDTWHWTPPISNFSLLHLDRLVPPNSQGCKVGWVRERNEGWKEKQKLQLAEEENESVCCVMPNVSLWWSNSKDG